jgi:hypothetical protein
VVLRGVDLQVGLNAAGPVVASLLAVVSNALLTLLAPHRINQGLPNHPARGVDAVNDVRYRGPALDLSRGRPAC